MGRGHFSHSNRRKERDAGCHTGRNGGEQAGFQEGFSQPQSRPPKGSRSPPTVDLRMVF